MNTPNIISDDRLLRLPEVEQIVQLKKPTIYRLAREGKFPKPLKIGDRASRWSFNELMQWIQEKRG